MNKNKALCLLSGGQDSTTCLYWAVQKYGVDNVKALGFDYKQRHKNELDAAFEICENLGVTFEVIKLYDIAKITKNSLTDLDISVDKADYEGEFPNTFVEGRNHIFLSYAAIIAKKYGISNIITGVCQTDFSGYPDCRDAFIKSLNVTLNLALEYEFNIITPLMWKNKAEIWDMAKKLGCFEVVKNKTVTCYNGIVGDGCGDCPACELRKRGFERMMNNG